MKKAGFSALLCLYALAAPASAAGLLPDAFPAARLAHPAHARGSWTVNDIVEVREISGIAVDNAGKIAFIVKQSFVASGDIRYGLYLVEQADRSGARKLIESSYLADLSWHPDTELWTVRGDFGAGIQLYDVDAAGKVIPVVVSTDVSLVGGVDGVIPTPMEGPRNTGILSYEWAPDGSMLWYSRMRLRPLGHRAALTDGGIFFDANTMDAHDLTRDPTVLLAVELRILDRTYKDDRLLLHEPRSEHAYNELFRKDFATISWAADSRRIQYIRAPIKADGERDVSLWSIDVHSRQIVRDGEGANIEMFYSVPAPDGSGFLVVRPSPNGHRLIQVISRDDSVRDLGPVDYGQISRKFGFWLDARSKRMVLGVSYRDREGLAVLPQSPASAALASVRESLNHCAFSKDLALGACVRESLGSAPELVTVSVKDGSVKSLVRPNAHYDRIEPLRAEWREWTNRYGDVSDGYVIYPRNYFPGKRHPAILVTHGNDAKNKFLSHHFEWEFPVEVFAERGYFVIAANEPRETARGRAEKNAVWRAKSDVSVAQVQRARGFGPVASMEAALTSLIERGMVDPDKTGIAGYSRGGEVVEYVLTQSKLFKVGAVGEAGAWRVSGFWSRTAAVRFYHTRLYGGGPFDAHALENYRRFSPSFRTQDFAGPLLQQFAAGNAAGGLERDTLLREAGIPTELVFFPREAHLFWQPRARRAAMIRNLDWFDYWLREQKDPEPSKAAQYRRWDDLARPWKRTPAVAQ